MATLSITYTLTAGTQENVSHVQQNFSDISAWANGNIGKDNLTSAFLDELGLTSGGTVRKAYATVATEQTTTSAAYTDLATPGPSVSITAPSNGLVMIYAEAEMKYTTGGTVDIGLYEATDIPTASTILGNAGTSFERRVTAHANAGNVYGNIFPTTLGSGFLTLPATAGNRTYSLKYRNTGGFTGHFKNRKLWAWVIGF